MSTAALRVAGLSVRLPAHGGMLDPVRQVDFAIAPGETLGLVGESGSGKSVTANAIMGLLPRLAEVSATTLELEGEALLGRRERDLADLRGNRMSMIFQDPLSALNPVHSVGRQLEEVWLRHRPGGRVAARARAIELLGKIGVSRPEERLRQFPHQLSGGQRQRIVIAMALMCGPKVLIADEPTTALDVTVQAQTLRLLKDMQLEFGLALLFITHDLGVVARLADRVAVMYAGEIVELASTSELFRAPRHPYTRALLASAPRLQGPRESGQGLAGSVPVPRGVMPGCWFRARCGDAVAACAVGSVALREAVPDHWVRCLREES